jgi:endonuclease/exonuclease/phosphatase (EEP) superfamily protein YafD
LAAAAVWLPTGRKVYAVVAVVLALSFVWPWLGDLWANRVQPTAPALKVVAFNWKGDSPQHGDVYAWLRRDRPDVLSIEEFEPTEPGALQQMAALFPYRFTDEADGDTSLWSRYPIKAKWGQEIYDRNYNVAVIAAPGGDVTVYAVHPETLRNNSQLALRNSFFLVLALSIDSRPNIVMMGDFNATRWDPYFRKVRAAGHLHEQPWLFPPLTRLQGNNPFIGVPLDHVLAGTRGHLSDCHTGPALGSDHVPMICSVAFAAK